MPVIFFGNARLSPIHVGVDLNPVAVLYDAVRTRPRAVYQQHTDIAVFKSKFCLKLRHVDGFADVQRLRIASPISQSQIELYFDHA